jgi:Transglutaminase-like superfamily
MSLAWLSSSEIAESIAIRQVRVRDGHHDGGKIRRKKRKWRRTRWDDVCLPLWVEPPERVECTNAEWILRLLVPILLAACTTAAQADDVRWYVIETQNGTAIGHASEETIATRDGRDVIDSQEMDVGEQVGPPTQIIGAGAPSTHLSSRTTFHQDKDGRTLSIETYNQTGRDWSRVEAKIEGDKAVVTRETSAEKRAQTIALPPSVRFDDGAALLEGWDAAKTPRLEFDSFDIDAMAAEHVVIEAAGPADAEGKIEALRKRFAGGAMLNATRIVVGRDGHIVEARHPMFGNTIVIKAADRDTALAPHPAYRLLPNAMTKSLYRIPQPATLGHMRYRFAFRDGTEFALPQTGEQRVRSEKGFATVDICADCGPGLATDAATLADALKPTAWLQSDAPQLKEIAEPVAKLQISDSAKMHALLDKARPYLGKIDFTGHYSALETIERRAGDCTEASVLLAALGRSAGIPTRVVNGLVYSRESYHGVANAWMPHSWTLAFADGKWRSFDLALDNFDSTHIALTVGDGDEQSVLAAAQLAGLLTWDSMAEVRTAPSN